MILRHSLDAKQTPWTPVAFWNSLAAPSRGHLKENSIDIPVAAIMLHKQASHPSFSRKPERSEILRGSDVVSFKLIQFQDRTDLSGMKLQRRLIFQGTDLDLQGELRFVGGRTPVKIGLIVGTEYIKTQYVTVVYPCCDPPVSSRTRARTHAKQEGKHKP